MSRVSALAVGVTAIALTGCAVTAIEQNGGFVDDYAKQNLGAGATWHKNGEARAAARFMAKRLLEQQLAADNAVRLALALSPTFQIMLAKGAAQSAAATQSARLLNPIFTFERLIRRDGGGVDLDIVRMLSVSLLKLIYLPSRCEAAAAAKNPQTSAGRLVSGHHQPIRGWQPQRLCPY